MIVITTPTLDNFRDSHNGYSAPSVPSPLAPSPGSNGAAKSTTTTIAKNRNQGGGRKPRYSVADVKSDARGNWPAIIERATGIGDDYLSGDHGPCPKCGGIDRWRVFDDFAETGGAICNQCGKFGDGFKVIEWANGDPFLDAVRQVAELAGTKPEEPSKPTGKPTAKSQVAILPDGISAMLAVSMWCRLRSTQRSQEAVAAVNGKAAIYSKRRHSVIAVPILGKSLDPNNPVGYWVTNQDGQKLWSKGDIFVKHKVTAGCGAGVVASPLLLSALQTGENLAGKTIIKVEGIPALIALLLIDPNVLAWTNAHGSKETPQQWIIDLFAKCGVDRMYVIHDCDTAGHDGARIWASAMATVVSDVRIVALPYEKQESGGKDIGDYVADGHTIADLQAIADSAARVEANGDAIATAGAESTNGRKKSERSVISNYEIEIIEESDGNGGVVEKRIKVELPVAEIAKQVLESTNGWPKLLGKTMFVGRDGEVQQLIRPAQLFGFLRDGAKVRWANGETLITKDEFFSAMPRYVDAFDAVELYPHFPPMHRHYYACDTPPHGTSGRLSEFLDFFCFKTDYDRELFKGFIATLFWGGPPGARPGYLFTGDGTGSGKTKAVEKASRLVGGCIQPNKADEKQLRTDLMSPGQAHKRIVLIDNLREHLANETIESMITSPEIAGHEMYKGYRPRPNVVTWCITANGASLSRDLSERCVTIQLRRPVYDGQWEAKVDAFIESYRDDIVSEIAGLFAQEPVQLSKYTRWSGWEAAVLARLKNPEELQAKIIEQGQRVDSDRDDAEAIEDYVRAKLKVANYSPDSAVVHIPNLIASIWLAEAIGQRLTSHATTRIIDRLSKSGSLPRIKRNPSRSNGRGLVWTGENAAHDSVDYDLETRLEDAKRRDRTF